MYLLGIILQGRVLQVHLYKQLPTLALVLSKNDVPTNNEDIRGIQNSIFLIF